MCGIAGIYAYHYAANAVDRAELRRIRDHMAARGPDGLGEWYSQDERVGFGHRRLTIIDLSERGAQPMMSADGKLVVTFNGEIYNYRQLRASLEAKGHRFRTQTDTEVLLHLYSQKGEAMVQDLRGMFAFGLWDAEKHALLLVRDPYGIKPLYYADDGWTVRFASQVKALLAGAKVSRDPEPAGWVGFCLFGSVPEPFTTYQDVLALPAGSTLWVDRVGTHEAKQYFSIADTYCRAEVTTSAIGNKADQQDRAREALLDSVRDHLVADVPVGAFLSSGIDSGALVGLMRDAGQQQIQTVTVAFEEFRGSSEDEAPIAAEVASRYGTRHTTRVVTEQEFQIDLPKILEAMDQPTIDGLNTWFVSKAARELGLKVAISGLGGDELFGGYPSFREVPLCVRALAIPGRIPALGDLTRWLLTRDFSPSLNPKAAGLLKYGGSYAGAYFLRRGLFMPWEVEALIGADTRLGLRRLNPIRYIEGLLEPKPSSSFSRIAVLESSLYMRNQLLRDTDWASMAHSLEVRLPLVDSRLLNQFASITARNGSQSKRLLAHSPRVPLSPKVIERPKTGFTTPIQSWLQRDNRIQEWRQVPSLAAYKCAWARRWAFEVSAPRRERNGEI